MYDHDPEYQRGEMKLYTLAEVSKLTTLTKELLLEGLRNGHLLGRMINGEWQLTIPEIKFIYFRLNS